MGRLIFFLVSALSFSLPSYSFDNFETESLDNIKNIRKVRTLLQSTSSPDVYSPPVEHGSQRSSQSTDGELIALAVTIPVLTGAAIATAIVTGCLGYFIGKFRTKRRMLRELADPFQPTPNTLQSAHQIIVHPPPLQMTPTRMPAPIGMPTHYGERMLAMYPELLRPASMGPAEGYQHHPLPPLDPQVLHFDHMLDSPFNHHLRPQLYPQRESPGHLRRESPYEMREFPW